MLAHLSWCLRRTLALTHAADFVAHRHLQCIRLDSSRTASQRHIIITPVQLLVATHAWRSKVAACSAMEPFVSFAVIFKSRPLSPVARRRYQTALAKRRNSLFRSHDVISAPSPSTFWHHLKLLQHWLIYC